MVLCWFCKTLHSGCLHYVRSLLLNTCTYFRQKILDFFSHLWPVKSWLYWLSYLLCPLFTHFSMQLMIGLSFDGRISCRGSFGFWQYNAPSWISILFHSERRIFAVWGSCCMFTFFGYVPYSLRCFTIWIQISSPCAFVRILDDSVFFLSPESIKIWFSSLSYTLFITFITVTQVSLFSSSLTIASNTCLTTSLSKWWF